MKMILILASAFIAHQAFAAQTTTEQVLQDDAANLQFVSAVQQQVVVGEHDVVDPDCTSNDYPCDHLEYDMAPGLVVTVSYTAKDGFTEWQGDGQVTSDQGEIEVEIPAAKTFVSATIVTKNVTHQEIDDDKSTYCDRDNEGDQVDPSCVDNYVYKSVTAPGRVLQVVTE